MSGRKYSEVRILTEEVEQQLRLRRETDTFRAELEGLRAGIQDLLANASEGLRSSFSTEVDAAQDVLGRISSSHEGAAAGMAGAKENHGNLRALARDANKARDNLVVALTSKADDMGNKLARRLAEAEGAWIGCREQIILWHGEEMAQERDRELLDTRLMLDREQYRLLETELARMERELGKEKTRVRELEDKHQRRLFLLEGLRKVCSDMHFKELSEPGFEKEGDRGSRLIYSVDTRARGKIDFYLALDDEIRSYSESRGEHCPEHFDQISERLANEFSIGTDFVLEDGKPLDRHKNEADLPGDGSLKAKS